MLKQTKATPEKVERMASAPSSPSEQTCSLPRDPSAAKASLLCSSPSELSPSCLSGSSEQHLSKQEDPSPLSPPSPVARNTRLKNEDFSVTTNWCIAAISLLLICAILLSMVIIMGAQVNKLSNMSKEQRHLMHLQILILAETLRQLQTGKDHTCSVCKLQWVQRAEYCFLFSGKTVGWRWSNSFCKDKSSALAAVDTQEEMDFLKHETKKYFDLRYGQHKYHKFWIGLTYDTRIEKWRWANGTPCDLKLHAKLGQKGCLYLQNGTLHSQDCHEVACFICKTKVQFGWS